MAENQKITIELDTTEARRQLTELAEIVDSARPRLIIITDWLIAFALAAGIVAGYLIKTIEVAA